MTHALINTSATAQVVHLPADGLWFRQARQAPRLRRATRRRQPLPQQLLNSYRNRNTSTANSTLHLHRRQQPTATATATATATHTPTPTATATATATSYSNGYSNASAESNVDGNFHFYSKALPESKRYPATKASTHSSASAVMGDGELVERVVLRGALPLNPQVYHMPVGF